MNKDELFQTLESQFLTYKELTSATIQENSEKMVSLSHTSIHSTCLDKTIAPSTGDEIYVRAGVVDLLTKAQNYVDEFLSGYKIDVIYGYRHPDIQLENYQKIKKRILSDSDKEWNEIDLQEEIHRFIAVPEVAGHPTGGAIDVRLLDKDGNESDMGTDIHEFTKESYVFYPYIQKEAWLNRQKLRQCMLAVGFAPFDGEWWHFSYGDREWATYYNKPTALYDQIDFNASKDEAA